MPAELLEIVDCSRAVVGNGDGLPAGADVFVWLKVVDRVSTVKTGTVEPSSSGFSWLISSGGIGVGTAVKLFGLLEVDTASAVELVEIVELLEIVKFSPGAVGNTVDPPNCVDAAVEIGCWPAGIVVELLEIVEFLLWVIVIGAVVLVSIFLVVTIGRWPIGVSGL